MQAALLESRRSFTPPEASGGNVVSLLDRRASRPIADSRFPESHSATVLPFRQEPDAGARADQTPTTTSFPRLRRLGRFAAAGAATFGLLLTGTGTAAAETGPDRVVCNSSDGPIEADATAVIGVYDYRFPNPRIGEIRLKDPDKPKKGELFNLAINQGGPHQVFAEQDGNTATIVGANIDASATVTASRGPGKKVTVDCI